MNTFKSFKIWFPCLLLVIIAVSCDVQDGPTFGFTRPDCLDDNHYDELAGECKGYVILKNEQQTLDTISVCKAIFGGHYSKDFVVRDFPVCCLSFLIEEQSEWHDIVSQCTGKTDLSFVYKMTEFHEYLNGKDRDVHHLHNILISSSREHTVNLDETGRHKLVFEGKPLVVFAQGPEKDYDGVSLLPRYVIDTEANDTLAIEPTSSGVELIVQPRGNETYF